MNPWTCDVVDRAPTQANKPTPRDQVAIGWGRVLATVAKSGIVAAEQEA